ncbi:MAG: 3-deoxy-manno-octulosonate cytidylyltransferase [Deltaproteobacteria bacterium]|nr:3-deoxy-manno-octulosonate cytidylyltransferase [Deltaproteobacteria bacterium]
MKSGLSPLGVIPARVGSTRFPNKVLAPILGKPMIQHVWERAKKATRLGRLVIATDSQEVLRIVHQFGADAVCTPDGFLNGTERVAYVASQSDAPLIINLQGDEPLIAPEAIDKLICELEQNTAFDMATLAVGVRDRTQLHDPNVNKVVTGCDGAALYFSRQALSSDETGSFLKHIGIYAYRRETLLRLVRLPSVALERAEKLEQLRALAYGIRIKIAVIDEDTIAVDVPSDITKVEAFLKARIHS